MMLVVADEKTKDGYLVGVLRRSSCCIGICGYLVGVLRKS